MVDKYKIIPLKIAYTQHTVYDTDTDTDTEN